MYRNLIRSTAAGLAILLGVCGVASAQEQDQQRPRFGFGGGPGGPGGPGGFGFGGGGGMDLLGLARRDEVAKSLKLTDDEKAFINLFAEDQGEKDRQEFAKLREGGEGSFEDRMAKVREYQQSRNKAVETQLTEIIGADRTKRLKEIQVQVAGPMMLFSPVVLQDLSIDEEQREKIGEAMREATEEAQDVIRKMQEEKIGKVLTEEQRSKWNAMKGEPIDFKLPPQRFDRRRGGDDDGDRSRRRPDNT